jgi:hypothetical protein
MSGAISGVAWAGHPGYRGGHPANPLNSDHDVSLEDLVFEPAVNAFQAARESM